MNFCELIKNINREPNRMVSDFGLITVRDFMQLEEHVATCQDCQILVDKTLEKADPNEIHIGFKTDLN